MNLEGEELRMRKGNMRDKKLIIKLRYEYEGKIEEERKKVRKELEKVSEERSDIYRKYMAFLEVYNKLKGESKSDFDIEFGLELMKEG